MKACLTALSLCAASLLIPVWAAEPTDADRDLFRATKAKAEKGDAQAQSDLGGVLFFGRLGLEKDEVGAVKWYRKAADQNYAPAQSDLGVCYAQGRGVAKDEVEAVKWFRKAAEQNDASAQVSMGGCYANGQGVAKDKVEAVKWYRKAAEQKFANAQYNLGVCYYKGEGVAMDESEAVEWYRKAAEQDYAPAQHNLGFCYAQGRGVAKDEVEAVKWYRKAAELAHAPAQVNLGACYAKGQGVAKDEGEAVKWYRKAAEQNYAPGQYNLGVCYDSGEGVAKDEVEGVKWYRKAAEQKYAPAQQNLGFSYDQGRGVAKDEVEAVKWFRKAAEQGDAVAQFNLGLCYAKGDGVAKDEVEAVKWSRKAAEQNHAGAQYNLGLFYCRGEGVAKDEVEAYKWWLLAGAQGAEDAKKFSGSLERMITATQRAEGQKLAREFRPRSVPSGFAPDGPKTSKAQPLPESSGTGFFITDDGYIITNQHVADRGATVRLVMAAGLITAKVVKVDKANDLTLLKAEGKFTALPVIASRDVRLGATAATVGFPNTGLQGFAPKLAKGEIASLAGAQDDARHFQISAPIQPGNSGGALVDERGNVIGVVVGKLSQTAALATSGALAENVNYAVKSSYLLSFLESFPEVTTKLKEANTKNRKFEDVVKAVEQATVLVLVY